MCAQSMDLVLVGAEAVVENGGIINKLGTYQVWVSGGGRMRARVPRGDLALPSCLCVEWLLALRTRVRRLPFVPRPPTSPFTWRQRATSSRASTPSHKRCVPCPGKRLTTDCQPRARRCPTLAPLHPPPPCRTCPRSASRQTWARCCPRACRWTTPRATTRPPRTLACWSPTWACSRPPPCRTSSSSSTSDNC